MDLVCQDSGPDPHSGFSGKGSKVLVDAEASAVIVNPPAPPPLLSLPLPHRHPLFLSETGSQYATLAGLYYLYGPSLPLYPECWDKKGVTPHLAIIFLSVAAGK